MGAAVAKSKVVSTSVSKSGKSTISANSRQPVTKTTDSKGRVILGGRFANRAVIVQWLNDTEMLVKLARVIPESEAWLYDNADALSAVRTGLSQARAGKLTSGPDVDADAEFAAKLKD